MLRTPLLDELREEYEPLLDKIAAGTVARELSGELPIEPVRWLKEAGFGALRVPERHGGRGVSWPELGQLWIDVAAADANLAQALRGHFALVEDRVWHHRLAGGQERWFARFVAGEIAGNAWSETGPTAMGDQQTVLVEDEEGLRLEGEKFYTTGTTYAEWADVLARRVDSGAEGEASYVVAIVDTRQAGVRCRDDWTGFGQRGTGSGTTVFEAARVDADDVLAFEDRFPYQTAVYQLNLLATLAGIARAATADAVAAVRARERNFSHANTARVRDDPQVLAVIGEIASAAYLAEAATLRVATAVQEVADLADAAAETIAAANEVAEIEVAQAQVLVTRLVVAATSDLFDTLGASATARSRALDRHWRNARTVASHNPRILKARVVGDHLVNGAPPPYAWGVGRTER
ncbi:MAG: acyl-CoA dehydrogenase family protein [Nocardioidaceae bacterium]